MKIEIFGYKTNINYTQKIIEQNLLHETKVLLSVIYRDYLCEEEERNRLLLEDRKAIEESEKIMNLKYKINFEKIREERQQAYARNNINVKETGNEIVLVKNKWYQRVYYFIKNLFIKK